MYIEWAFSVQPIKSTFLSSERTQFEGLVRFSLTENSPEPKQMALWMEPGSEPTTEKELADLDAIQAIKESAAIELKVSPFPCFQFFKLDL